MIWQGIIVLSIIYVAGFANCKTSIIQGKNASIRDFPYQVSLRYKNKHFCGGAIISEQYVLTAGHCFVKRKRTFFKHITAVTGTEHRGGNRGNHHKITNVTIHPDYFSDGYRSFHDIAVVKLSDPIVFDIRQHKINLPENNFKVGDKAIVTGWGFMRQLPKIIRSDALQKLETEIISRQVCQSILRDSVKTKIYGTEICTKRTLGTGICFGDSGGPLVVQDVLVGIVSWFDGDRCATIHPDVYTNVFAYKTFITSAMSYQH